MDETRDRPAPIVVCELLWVALDSDRRLDRKQRLVRWRVFAFARYFPAGRRRGLLTL